MTQKPLPNIEDFKTSDGKSELRELFAVSVFRALTPREQTAVKKHLKLSDLPKAA